MQNDLYDITIVGGGPVGLFAAFYAGLRGMKTKIVDSLGQLGGQLTAIYPEKFVYDVGGFPKVLAKDLAKGFIEQGTRFQPTVCLEETVTELVPGADRSWEVRTNRGVHRSKTVLLAMGVGAFEPKKLPVPNLPSFEGKGVHYFVKSKADFAGKKVMIVGGGDSAIDYCLMLEPVASAVTLIHRRPGFRAQDEGIEQVHKSRVRVKIPFEVKSVHGNGCLERVTIFDNKTMAEEVHDVDALVFALGFVADVSFLKRWGLEIEGNQVKTDPICRTNLPGVFAAGDIAVHPGSLRLIATGVGDAAIAVCNAKVTIDPSEKVFPGHSSELKL
jgi:thioredoxin reductase (NADPH)